MREHLAGAFAGAAYDRYATQAFEVAAMDYVLKPVQVDRLKATVERLKAREGEGGAPVRAQRRVAQRFRESARVSDRSGSQADA